MTTPFILAIEPDARQASRVAALAGTHVHADIEVVDSLEAVMRVLDIRVPDLILTSLLLSPKDDAALMQRLRTIDTGGEPVPTLVVPVLASSTVPAAAGDGGLLRRLRKPRGGQPLTEGCAPGVFATQVNEYLARAQSERLERAASLAEQNATPAARVAAPMLQDWLDTREPALHARQDSLVVDPPAGALGSATADDVLAPLADATDPPDFAPWPDAQEPAPDIEASAAEGDGVAPVIALPVDEPSDEPVVVIPSGDTIREPIVLTVVTDAVAAAPDAERAEADTRPDESPVVVVQAVDESGLTWDDLAPFLEDLELAERLAAVPSSPHSDEDEPSVIELPAPDELWSALDESAHRAVPRIEGAVVRDRPAPEPPVSAGAVPAMDSGAVRPAKPKRARVKPARPRRATAPSVPAAKPMQDEWGLYDPEQCGFAALLQRLDSITQAQADERKERDRSAIMRR